MALLLGCIADDMTGATDLGSILVHEGLPTLMTMGVPSDPLEIGCSQAIVVALKSRMLPASMAVEQSLGAYAWLKNAGAQQILFKYCSTFDSTDAGNIGPVGEALLEATVFAASRRMQPMVERRSGGRSAPTIPASLIPEFASPVR